MSTNRLKDGSPKYTKEDIADMLPPQHWEFTKKPWYFGLLVKVFRRDPQLALHVASVMDDDTNRPISRAAMRREKQHLTVRTTAISNTSSSFTSSSPTDDSVLTSFCDDAAGSRKRITVPTTSHSVAAATAACNQNQLLRAKMLASKAHAEATNIAKRMGKMEELEKGMALLEKMRPVIGESTYATRVHSLFAALPNFEGFDAAVDIIDVDSTPPANNKRHLSSDKEDGRRMTTKKANNGKVTTTVNDDDIEEDDSEDVEGDERYSEDYEDCI